MSELSAKRMKTKKASPIWSFFKKISENKAKCQLCGNEYRTCGNTSNLIDHMKRKHPIQWNYNTVDDDVDNPAITRKENIQINIPKMFEQCQLYPQNSERKKLLDEKLIDMITTDMHPFNIVTHQGLQSFVKALDPRYQLPSNTYLKTTLILKRYATLQNKLVEVLKTASYCAITTDIWTSKATEAYMTVTSHFIYKGELKSATLSTKQLTENHTAINISKALSEVFDEWGISQKVICIVTDNARNMINAVDNLRIRHQPCFAHTMNLTVNDCLDHDTDLEKILQKCRGIVTYFRQSVLAADKLRNVQNSLNKKVLKLVQETKTRWNNTLYMVKRIIDVLESLTITQASLRNGPPILISEKISVLEDLIILLAPFEVATVHLSGAQYATTSLIIPITCEIFQELTKCENNLKTDLSRKTCKKLQQSVVARLFPYEMRTTSSLATLLDPRFKKFGFRSCINADNAVKKLQSEFTNEVNSLNNLPQTLECSLADTRTDQMNILTNKDTSIAAIFKFVDDRIAKASNTSTLTSDSIISIRQYIERNTLTRSENVIKYWQDNANSFPIISKLAEKFLCTPATSVPSERVFSDAGQIISNRRCSLKPKNFNYLLFIRQNKWLLNIEL